MMGIGTLINTVGVIIGGVVGMLFGNLLKEKYRDALRMAIGICVLFLGISGVMEQLLKSGEGISAAGRTMIMTGCMALGTLIGEIIDIEYGFEKFAEWLKKKSGNANDPQFVSAFLTATLTTCVGAMAIMGAVRDGLTGDWSLLATKTLLDFVTIMIMTSSMWKGCIFCAIPIFVYQGVLTLFASLIRPVFTPLAMDYLSLVGSVLIFCIGFNMIWDKKIRIANMLPAVVLAVFSAFLPFSF
ncbi:MAG: DUF554 domain-containing protein [Clostridiales bacterium]|nr:DUF554 domain-containing protein [Clostridiales bacterium]